LDRPKTAGTLFMATTAQAPKTWHIVVSGLFTCFLLLASFALALFGAASYNDSYSHDADKMWGIASLAAGGLLFLASCGGLAFLCLRRQAIWYGGVSAHGISLLGLIVVVVAGFQMMAAAKQRGGDWGALAVLGSLIFGIVIPGFLAFTVVANSCVLFRL